jgi:hypothetical protein
LRSLVFLRSFQEKKVTGAVIDVSSDLCGLGLGIPLRCGGGGKLTDEQEGVVDEEVADGPGCEAGVAVAEDDHDHPCSAEVGLAKELVVSEIDG